jgi:hypothetical protein
MAGHNVLNGRIGGRPDAQHQSSWLDCWPTEQIGKAALHAKFHYLNAAAMPFLGVRFVIRAVEPLSLATH